MTEEMKPEKRELTGRFFSLRWQWHDFWDTDPDRSIAMIEEAIGIAEQLEQPIWVMECRHWLAQAIVFKKRDYARGLPLVVQSAVDASKPTFQGWRTRICLYQDLIAAYIGADAISNATIIENALSRMQAESPPEAQCTRCLLGERTSFELKQHNLEYARLSAQTYLSKSNEPHHQSQAQAYIAHLSFLSEDWKATLKHAEAAEKLGSEADNQDIVVEALIHQAIAHLKLGDLNVAKACFSRSEAQRSLYGITLDIQYWNTRVAYFEALNDLDSAISSRKAHLDAIAGHGALREEAEALIDLCRLQKQVGGIAPETIQKAQTAISALKIPADLPIKLAQITER
ncbi:MAG: hypothetical protein HUU38_19295 [Anaerolineales bacterium]|nr:hypothetical protein [Anaerolineales bacterium]